MHSTMPCTGSRSTGRSSRKSASATTTRLRSPYPVNMPWHIIDTTSKFSAPRVACALLHLNRNTGLPSSGHGADPTGVKPSSRSSSQTRGMTSLQAPTLTSSNVECWKALRPQMPFTGYLRLRVKTPHHPIPQPFRRHHNNPAAPKTTTKIYLGQTTRVS